MNDRGMVLNSSPYTYFASPLVPTFLVAFFSTIDNLSGLNELLNCLMSLMLPFALLPTIAFSSDHRSELFIQPSKLGFPPTN